MKPASLIVDRDIVLRLLHLGLTGSITVLLSPNYNYITTLIAVVSPLFIVLPISKWKFYKELIFKDERYPDRKEKNINLLIFFLFLIGYGIGLVLSDFLEPNFLKDIWCFGVQLVYFLGVFLLFINRISCK